MDPAEGRRPVVVVATYNERSNVERLLPAVLAADAAMQVVVVDDASPDGTADAVDEVGRGHPGRVHLLRRPAKLGYGSAHVDGMRRALELGGDPVLTMDADFSHAPESIPALLQALDAHDVVVGSRYVGGIRILNWSLWRLLLSLAANRYARTILRLGCADCTSGFRAYRRAVLMRVDPGATRSNGYAFLVELLYRVVRAGFDVGEVPIVYEDRQHGESKMDRGVILEAAWKPWALRLRGGGSAAASRRGAPQ